MKRLFKITATGCICWFSFFCFYAHAEEVLIKCKDGAVVLGEVVSMQDGVYIIKSRTLGDLSVRGGDVVSITSVEEASGAVSSQSAVKKQIFANPQIMASIQDLAKDQGVLDMLADPDLKAAIMRQDVEYLQQNEKFIRFMNRTSVQDIVQSVAAQSRDSSRE